MQKFGIGVIGATGYIGTPYRSEIREATADARIVALCARRRDRLEAAAKEDSANFITDDWRQVVEHPEVDFVIVATPDALHYEAVLACAKQEKHLFCEKPVGVNTKEAYEMWAAYREKQLGHYVPYWTRYVPVFSQARSIVASGQLGDIKGVVYRWHNPRPAAMPFTWRDDASLSAAGSVADVGSHAYDVVRWILGTEARRVLAHADVVSPAKPDLGDIDLTEALDWGGAHAANESNRQRQATAFDYAAVAWEFDNGAVGAIVLSHAPFFRKGLAPELELHGTKASLGIDRIAGNVSLVRPDEPVEIIESVDDPGLGNRFSKHVFPAVRQRATGEKCEHPGLEEGWRVQIFTDAVVASASRGGWVDLAEFDTQQD